MIVGSVAGGVTDVGARVVGRFIGKYLATSPSVVTQNIPAANGIAAANYFYQQATADGLTFLAGSSSQVTPDVVRSNPAVHYDPTRFSFIGGIQNSGTLLVVTRSAKARLAARAPVIMAQVGGARTAALMAVFAAEYLGWNLRWVTGYQGTPQVVFALMKGEADMFDTAGVGAIEAMIKSGDLVPVLQTGVFAAGKLKPRESFTDIPLLSDALAARLPAPGRSAFENWLKTVQIGKYYALPPNTPASYVAAYRAAFAAMQNDPEFVREARAAIDPDYVMMTAQETASLIADLAETPNQDLEFLNRLRNKYGLPSGSVGGR
jgi:tripartite-type tricarboxylate transporter receptor subunit TctC